MISHPLSGRRAPRATREQVRRALATTAREDRALLARLRRQTHPAEHERSGAT